MTTDEPNRGEFDLLKQQIQDTRKAFETHDKHCDERSAKIYSKLDRNASEIGSVRTSLAAIKTQLESLIDSRKVWQKVWSGVIIAATAGVIVWLVIQLMSTATS